MGNTVQNFYVETFADSYGDPQSVEVVAKKSLGDVKLRYRINDGPVQDRPTRRKFMGGERFGEEPGLYYHRLRGTVTGTNPGDEVEVWFEGGRRSSSHFTYTARSETGNKVLILSAENYTAGVPTYPDTTGPTLPDLLHRRAGRQRRRVRHLRRRQARQRLAGPPRRAQPLRRRALVHRRRLPDPPARPARGHRHGAPGGRGDDRRPPLPQRGRQAVLHRQERRPAVRRGQPVPQLRVPGAAGGRHVVRQRQAGVRRGRPGATPTAASPTTTTSSSTTWGPTSTRRPATRSTTRTATRTRCAAPARSTACRGCSTRPAPTTRTTRRPS